MSQVMAAFREGFNNNNNNNNNNLLVVVGLLLGHPVHDPVLSSLKMEGIGLLFVIPFNSREPFVITRWVRRLSSNGILQHVFEWKLTDILEKTIIFHHS
jgi:hypothetical protein